VYKSELDKALAEAALLLLEGSAWKAVPDGLLMTLLACLPGGRLSAWHRDLFLWGDPELKAEPDEASAASSTLTTSGGKWRFMASDDGVVMLAEVPDATSLPPWLVERLFSCHRILVHWRHDRSSEDT
jgi:hypothetical protein